MSVAFVFSAPDPNPAAKRGAWPRGSWSRPIGRGDSAGGPEIGTSVARHHGVLSVSGMPVVCLPSAVGVGPAALSHTHCEFGATSTASREHGVGDLTTGIGDGEVEAGSGSGDHGVLCVVDLAIIQGGRSECNPESVGDDRGSATQIIPNDQAKDLRTLGRLLHLDDVLSGGDGQFQCSSSDHLSDGGQSDGVGHDGV